MFFNLAKWRRRGGAFADAQTAPPSGYTYSAHSLSRHVPCARCSAVCAALGANASPHDVGSPIGTLNSYSGRHGGQGNKKAKTPRRSVHAHRAQQKPERIMQCAARAPAPPRPPPARPRNTGPLSAPLFFCYSQTVIMPMSLRNVNQIFARNGTHTWRPHSTPPPPPPPPPGGRDPETPFRRNNQIDDT
ncbi:hypothetical protein EVAR_27823_1 [Eumeta japonica]|uniref:Uncharacterized protein n=1 Tax=Eumeta variegata TaxID=151549 RepID=A0A4C1VI60_EUMVA|nr:hypothetical protein EVAR_27823_1 [Eumeta japonica]